MQVAGLQAYARGDRLSGVSDGGRKHRFATLGLTAALAAAATAWQRLPGRLRVLQNDRLERARRYFRELGGYADELLETIAAEPATPGERLLREDRRRRREARFRELRRGREPPERSRQG